MWVLCVRIVFYFALRFTRRCVSVAPSRETAGELLLGKMLTTAHTCFMHNIFSFSKVKRENSIFYEVLPLDTSVRRGFCLSRL